MSSHTAGPFGPDACCANASPPASTAPAMPACKNLLRVTAIEPQIVTDKLRDVPRFGRALDAAQHGRREVLALTPARVHDPCDMEGGEGDQRIAERLVRLLDPFHAPEAIRHGEPAGERSERCGREEGDDHPAAERVVPEVAGFFATHHRLGIRKRALGPDDEVAEAGIPRSAPAIREA